MKETETKRQITEALKAAARLNTSQECPTENHAVVVLAMDALAAIKAERRAPRSSMQPVARRKLADALVAGYKLSNIAFNYAQNSKLAEGERALFKRACKEWDDSITALPKELRVSPSFCRISSG